MPVSQIVAIVLLVELLLTWYICGARESRKIGGKHDTSFWKAWAWVHLAVLLIGVSSVALFGLGALALGVWVIG